MLRLFIDELAAAFRGLGWAVDLIDLEVEADVGRLLGSYAKQAPVDLIFSFGIFGEITDGDGMFIGDIIGAPHVIQYVDYPLSHLTRLEQTSPRAGLLMVDESHVAAIQSLYGADRFAGVGFSPHAAIGPTISPGANPEAFAAARPIHILFPASAYGAPPVGWRDLPAGVRKVFDQAVEIALASDWTPPLDALDQAMTTAGLDPANPDFAAFRKLATYVHEHVRAVRRSQLLEAIIRLGLPVHLVGKGHDADLARHKNLTLLGEARFDEVLALMAGSRVVLNVNANFGAGSHERPLTASNAGAVAASDASAFYAANFEAGSEMAIYRWTRLDADLTMIGALAENPTPAFAIARAGQRRVVTGHLWIHRVAGVIAAAQQARSRIAVLGEA